MIRWARRLGFLAAGLFAVALVRDGFDLWIDRTVWPDVISETSTEFRDRNGRLLRVFPVADGIWRLKPGAVDPDFLAMLLRHEDKRFRTHAGVDPKALLRAAVQAVWHGRAVSGGSTLTMQVARLIEDGPTGRWSGKLRQIRLALALERRMDKDAILALYLTHAPYGGNLEGVRAATLAWFGKEPQRLTPAQAALLVALPQSPERRRPDRHPQAASEARDRVLARAVRQSILTQDAFNAARAEAIPDRQRRFPLLSAHLTDRLREIQPGVSQQLTLDAGLQQRLEVLAGEAARRAGPRLSVAMIVADHQNGQILASVGSAGYALRDRRGGFVDMTQALRSPGSLLKPLVYGLAFDRGLAHPETLIHDGPVQFGSYAPQNFDGGFRGDIRLRAALQQSLNIPVVKLADAMGPARLVATAERSGARLEIPGGTPGLAVALGGLGMSLHDLVQLYAGIAAGGQGVKLHHGQRPRAASKQLLSAEAAWQIGDILSGLSPPPGAPGGALAYKTGTSYGHRDAWAIGYDGRHVIGVWMGRPDGTPVPGAFGGDIAAPVLFEAFGRLKPGFDRLPPPPPATLLVSGDRLPLPLQRFRARAGAAQAGSTLDLVFPPDGARLANLDGALTIKLRGGEAPFSVLADGRAVLVGQPLREFQMPYPGAGYTTLVVVDREGGSDRVTIRLD